MKTKKFTIVGATGCLIAAFHGIASPASAADLEDPPGWTQSEFVAAAAAEGVPVDVAAQAWLDPDRLKQIPVGSSLESSGQGSDESASATGYSAWCAYTKTNVLGQTLARLTVSSDWSAEGSGIVTVDTNIETEVGWGWAFQGLPYSKDAYSTAFENPQGAHTAIRWANYSWGPDGDASTLKVSIVSLALGSHTCSSQEN
ncbi:MAG: hypothetical protein Q7T71_09640 [Herbiconiux sp.]|nr:hypothetical protein [Herbiconiux sp.]